MSDSANDIFLLPKRVVNRITRPLGINVFPRAFGNDLAGNSEEASEVFDRIFRQNYWGSQESRSGTGSETGFTNGYRNRLQTLLHERGLKKIFDAPCGDLNWISAMIDGSEFDYSGGDISTDVIASAKAKRPDLNLRTFDIRLDDFPDADVWHCRDCLFHLPFSSIKQSFENFLRSDIPYALITSHRARLFHKNLDVGLGGFRFLDLQRAPFNLPPPLVQIRDFVRGKEFPRYVCLWSRAQIAGCVSTT